MPTSFWQFSFEIVGAGQTAETGLEFNDQRQALCAAAKYGQQFRLVAWKRPS